MHSPRTVIDDPPQKLSDYECKLVEQVRKYGWRSTSVADSDPAFTYTTGFWLTLQQPEVIVFDFPSDLAHDVLGQMFRELQRGRVLPTGEPLEKLLGGERVYLFPVKEPAVSQFLRSGHWFYKKATFPCLQLVWPDAAGRFPWEDGFDATLADLQPDLSATGWKNEL